MRKKRLVVSLAADLFFIAVVLYYVVSPVYLGAFPIGIAAGICVALQLTTLCFFIKDQSIQKEKLKAASAVAVNVVSMVVVGYFFLVWWMTI